MKWKEFILIVASALFLIGVAGFAFLYLVVYPQLKPMMSWNAANVLSERFSHVTSEDFKRLSIPIPSREVTLSSEEASRIVERLHSSDRFPDWKPGSQLRDFNGQPFIFSVRPTNSPKGHREFIVGVTSPSVKEVIEH